MGRARDRASADLNGQEFILDADADTSISEILMTKLILK